MKNILALFFCLSCSCALLAQAGKIALPIFAGLGTPILDNGTVYQLGINPYVNNDRFITIEGQLGISTAKITGTFLSGRQGSVLSAAAFAGPRLYFNAAKNKTRPYINLLVGGIYSQERIDGQSADGAISIGYSIGGYVKINRFTIGLAAETPGHFLFKAGYTFGVNNFLKEH